MSMLAEEVIQDKVPAQSDPGKSGAGYDEARLEHFLWTIGHSGGDFRKPYSADLAMTLSAVWACGRIIASALSMLGWHVYETTGSGDKKGKRCVDPDERTQAGDVAWYLNWTPNGEQTAVSWRETRTLDALFQGNAYTYIDTDTFGRIKKLFRIEPSRVTPIRVDGDLYYVVKNGQNEDPSLLTPSQLLHDKGLGPDGLIGYSVISMARRTVELGISQEEFGRSFFEKGPMPGGVMEVPANLKQQDREQLRNDVQRLYGGAKNAGKVLVTGAGTKFNPLTIPNTDAQYLESRRFSVEEICRWFGVPPHKLADLTRATFSNIEHQAIEFVIDCLMPWARRFEAEADLKLFGRVNRGRFWTKHNFAAFLRGDSLSQAESLGKQVSSAMRTPNEAREQLDLNPIEGGDELMIQGAMVSLENAVNPPEPPAPAAPMPVEPTPDEGDDDQQTQDDSPPANMAAPLRLLFAQTSERLLRVEADKARRANNRGKLEDWKRDFYRDHAAVAAQYLPAARAALEAVGSAYEPQKMADFIAVAHNAYGSQARDIFKALDDKEWPAQFAGECLKAIWRKRP